MSKRQKTDEDQGVALADDGGPEFMMPEPATATAVAEPAEESAGGEAVENIPDSSSDVATSAPGGASADPAPSSLARAAQEELNLDWQTEAQARRELQAAYVEILLRYNLPQPQDASALASIMQDLHLTVDQVEQHAAAVKRMAELWAVYTRRDEIAAQVVSARAAKIETEKRHEREKRQVGMALHGLEMQQHDCMVTALEQTRVPVRTLPSWAVTFDGGFPRVCNPEEIKAGA